MNLQGIQGSLHGHFIKKICTIISHCGMTFSSLLSTIFFCPHTGLLTWDLTFHHTIHTSLTMSLVDGGGGGGEHAVFDDELFDDA